MILRTIYSYDIQWSKIDVVSMWISQMYNHLMQKSICTSIIKMNEDEDLEDAVND